MNINMTSVFGIFLVLCLLALIMIWLAALADCIKHETEQRALWLVLLVLGGLIVGPIYWFVHRPDRERKRLLARGHVQRRV